MLKEIGICNIKSFTDGTDCLEFIKNNKDWVPDIFLLDIIMKRLNGDDLCPKLRNEGYNCPIVALTGNVSKIDMDNYIKVGFNEIITKPYTTENIKYCIKQLIF